MDQLREGLLLIFECIRKRLPIKRDWYVLCLINLSKDANSVNHKFSGEEQFILMCKNSSFGALLVHIYAGYGIASSIAYGLSSDSTTSEDLFLAETDELFDIWGNGGLKASAPCNLDLSFVSIRSIDDRVRLSVEVPWWGGVGGSWYGHVYKVDTKVYDSWSDLLYIVGGKRIRGRQI